MDRFLQFHAQETSTIWGKASVAPQIDGVNRDYCMRRYRNKCEARRPCVGELSRVIPLFRPEMQRNSRGSLANVLGNFKGMFS